MPYINKKTGQKISDAEYNTLKQLVSPGKKVDISQLRAEAEASTKEAERLGGVGGLIKSTIAGLPKATAQVGLETPAKFITSAAESPRAIVTGKAAQKEYRLPFLSPFKSYISEAETRAGQIVEGKKPLYTALAPFAQVPLAGLETAGIAKGLFGDKVLTAGKTITGKIISPGEEIPGLFSRNMAIKQTMSKVPKKELGEVPVKRGLITRKLQRAPSEYEKDVAKVAKPFISRYPEKSREKITKEIARISNKEILPNLKKTNRILKDKDIRKIMNEIDSIELPAVTKGDPTQRGIYNIMMERIKSIIGSSKDKVELLENRKVIDDIVDFETGGKIFDIEGRPNAAYQAYRDARKIVNSFLTKDTPGLSDNINKQFKLYQALDGIKEKIADQVAKKSGLRTFGKRLLRVGEIGGIIGAGAFGAKKLIGE